MKFLLLVRRVMKAINKGKEKALKVIDEARDVVSKPALSPDAASSRPF